MAATTGAWLRVSSKVSVDRLLWERWHDTMIGIRCLPIKKWDCGSIPPSMSRSTHCVAIYRGLILIGYSSQDE